MKDIGTTLCAIIVVYLVAAALSHLKPLKVAWVKKVTGKLELQYTGCQKCGATKKAKALKILRWILIVVDNGTTSLIDTVVSIANEKKGDMVTSIKSVTSKEVSAKLKLEKKEDI